MGIAVLVGSSLFILAIINAGIVWYSPGTIKMNKQFFTRDALFLLAALILLLYSIVFRGKIDTAMSVLFIVLYCAYAVIVVYQDRLHEQEANSEVAKQAALAANMTELNTLTSFGQRPKDIETMDPLKAYDFEGQFKQESSAFYYVDQASREKAANEQTDVLLGIGGSDGTERDSLLSEDQSTTSSLNTSLASIMKEDHFSKGVLPTEDSANSQNVAVDTVLASSEPKKHNEMYILRTLKATIKRENLSLWKKGSTEEQARLRMERKDPGQRRLQAFKNCLHIVILKPIRFLLQLTIPNSESDKWNRQYASVNPPCGLILILIATNSIDIFDPIQ